MLGAQSIAFHRGAIFSGESSLRTGKRTVWSGAARGWNSWGHVACPCPKATEHSDRCCRQQAPTARDAVAASSSRFVDLLLPLLFAHRLLEPHSHVLLRSIRIGIDPNRRPVLGQVGQDSLDYRILLSAARTRRPFVLLLSTALVTEALSGAGRNRSRGIAAGLAHGQLRHIAELRATHAGPRKTYL